MRIPAARRLAPIVLAAGALGLAGGVVATAAQEQAIPASPFALKRGEVLRHMVLTSASVSPTRVGSTIRLRFTGIAGTARMVTTASAAGRGVNAVRVLPRYWLGTLGFQPTASLTYTIDGVRRTHVLRGGALPAYSGARHRLDVQFNATPQNLAVLRRMRASGASDVQITLLPTPAGPTQWSPGAWDPGVSHRASETQATVSTTAVTPYPPPAPNAVFTLPYMSQLGTSPTSWNNYLSATGETTPACQVYPTPSGIGGTTTTQGMIFVYQTSAQAQQSLNVGGSVGYKKGLAKASLSVSYSQQDDQSSTSMYAVAIVNFQGGVVNLGAPQFSTSQPSTGNSYATQAANVSSTADALQLMSECGDAYPVSFTTGATWISVLQIQTSSQSEQQQLTEKMKVSYAGIGAGTSFSQDLSSATSSASIVDTDECWGMTSCTAIPGYQQITTTDMTTALSQFTSNYSAALSGVPNVCDPTANSFNCITSVTYRPLSNLMSSTSGGSSVQHAAYGVFGVDQNMNAWDSEYQSLISGNPTSSSLTAWNAAVTNLGNQAIDCGMAGLSGTTCSTRFSQCYQSSQQVYSYLNAQCEPAAFPSSTGLSGLSDPFTIAGAPEANLAS